MTIHCAMDGEAMGFAKQSASRQRRQKQSLGCGDIFPCLRMIEIRQGNLFASCLRANSAFSVLAGDGNMRMDRYAIIERGIGAAGVDWSSYPMLSGQSQSRSS